MARVYAPARANSYTSDSTSAPKLTPMTSENSDMPARSSNQARPATQLFDSADTRPRVPFPGVLSTYPSSVSSAQYNAIPYNHPVVQQSGLPSMHGQYQLPFSFVPYPAYPTYPPSALHPSYVGNEQHGPVRMSPYHQRSPFVNGFDPSTQASMSAAQLEYEAQTPEDVKRVMAAKIVDALMELDISKDQVLATGAALISGLKSHEGFEASSSRPKHGDNTTRPQTPPARNTNNVYSADGLLDDSFRQDGGISQNDNANNWNSSSNDDWAGTDVNNTTKDSWGENAVIDNGCWSNSQDDKIFSDVDVHETPSSEDQIKSQHWPGNVCGTETYQETNPAQSWAPAPAGPVDEAIFVPWYLPGSKASRDLNSMDATVSSSSLAGKFEDPRPLSVSVRGTDGELHKLFVPKATLLKLFHHDDFYGFRMCASDEAQFLLPHAVGTNIEALKEMLHLLEMDDQKQYAVCNSGLTPCCHADMYAIAVRFHLDTIAQALMLSTFPLSSSLNDYMPTVTEVYAQDVAVPQFRENFKCKLRSNIDSLSDIWIGCLTRQVIEKELKDLKSMLSDVGNQLMKDDITEVLLAKICADARNKLEDHHPGRYDDHYNRPNGWEDPESEYERYYEDRSYEGDMDDNYDSGAEGPEADFEDEISSTSDRPPTPNN